MVGPNRGLLLVTLTLALFASVLASAALAAPLADSAILLIGDGMGPAQIALARQAGGGAPLTIETMPLSGLATTRSADRAVTDSAAAGTALATGHKTNNGMISVAPDGRRLATILERCQAMYKATGIITTDALHGATPAVFASHAESRGKRSGIALQMAESRVPVMMGFWKGWFLPKSEGGEREDGRDLISKLRRDGYAVAFTREQLADASGPRLVGLFDDGAHAPSLAEMTTAALQRLGTSANGFFLMVEGARIDWECHAHDAAGAVLDTWEFDQAVAVALDYARQRGRTPVVVTADHETGGLIVEDPERLRQLGRNQPDPRKAAVASLSTDQTGLKWTTTGHTATPVRVFASGPGAARFAGDMDNTDIPKRIAEILGIVPFPQ